MTRSALALLLLAVGACGAVEESAPESDAVSPVEIVTAVEEPFSVNVNAIGVITPRPDGVAELSAPGVSRVTSIRVGVGDAVAVGRLLISLDPSVWEAQLAETEAGVLAARQASERAARLADLGILPRKDAEQAAAELARAQAALAMAARTRSFADLRSPIVGVVDSLSVTMDEIVAEGTVLVRIVDPRAIEIVFRLPPAQAALVTRGTPVLAGPGGTDGGSWSARGRVTAVGVSIDAASGGVHVRAAIDSASRTLRIGEIVEGRIEVARHEHAIVVPAAAIVQVSGDRATLFTVSSDGLARAREVTLGARSGDRIEILAGLMAGEEVVGQGAYSVSDSSRVRAESGS